LDTPIRLLLVDSPALHRRSLAALLNRRRGIRVVGEASNGLDAIAQMSALLPDVAVVEPHVPDGGPSLIALLCQECPECAILVLTLSNDDLEVRQALQSGARGYLDKDREPDDLVQAIARIRMGELVVAQAAANTVLREFSTESTGATRAGPLTTREIEVLGQVALGRTNPQIAQELCITDHTVKAHLAKILAKLNLDNRVQIATYATQQGLIPTSELSSTVAS